MYLIRPLFLALVLVGSAVELASAQTIPPAIQAELNSRNMSEAEARAMAQQLGINLNDPVQAAQRARELGVPESTIQEMLRAIKDNEQGAAAASAVTGVATADPTQPPVAIDAGQAAATPPLTVTPGTSEVVTQATEAAELRDIEEAQTTTVVEEEAKAADLEFFGYSLFDNIPDAFQPSAVGPVDDGYIIGSGDELRLTVWGAAEFAYDLTVDAEGRIFVPSVGQFLASGRRMNVLREDLKRFLSQSYAGLTTDPPTISMDLTVARLRPVQVYVLGEVARPGGYTVSPYATTFNVLYATGGPLTRGSLRDIRIVRNGRRMGSLDLYSYLLNGYEESPVRLQTNDFVFVPPRGKTVAISGPVRRPAVFELTGDEGFGSLLEFAGGLLPDAYTKRFQVERIIPFDERTDPSIAREVLDFGLSEVLAGEITIDLRDGDVVTLFSISDRVDNSVSISGPVFQPGRYELSDTLRTVLDLFRAADGLTEKAYLDKAEIVRLREDLSERLISLDVSGILRDDPIHNIPLMARDQLRVFSVDDIQANSTVSITGYVRNPGSQPFRAGMSLYDLLFSGGGLQDSLYVDTVFLDRADILRRTPDGMSERIIPFNLGEALEGRGMALTPLEALDQVRVYSQESMNSRSTLSISGHVKNPQTIPYRENMTVYDLLFEGGGLLDSLFLPTVYLDRADILRRGADGLSERIIPFNLGEALKGQGMATSRLEPRDEVRVYALNSVSSRSTLTISGQVRNPQTIAFREEMTVFDLLFEGGGLQDSLFVNNVFLGRADIFRYTEDLQDKRVIPFNLGEALAERGIGRDFLVPGDEIRVYPRSAIQVRTREVSISGAVAAPAKLPWREGLTLEDVILQAGGFTPFSYLKDAEVSRSLYTSNRMLSETIRVPLLGDVRSGTGALMGSGVVAGEDTLAALFSARQFLLEPLDRVVIRTDPDYRPLETVLLSGELRFPGEYTLSEENERLSSVLRRAGGISDVGYAGGGRILRGGERLVINFNRALRGSRRHDIELLPGDQISIPRHPNTVRVSGNVLREGLFTFVSGKRVRYYLERAGGADIETEAVLVTQADGSTYRLRRGMFPANPKVQEGGSVTVIRKPPPDPNEEKVDVGGIITNTLSVISTALTAIILATRL
jgi:polysaccharide biosynthesis/export protein